MELETLLAAYLIIMCVLLAGTSICTLYTVFAEGIRENGWFSKEGW